jgi:hypothetical protein
MAAGSAQASMLRYAILATIGLFAIGGALAQQPAPQAEAPAPSPSTESRKTLVVMEEPLPGDHWTYEVQDEITGNISATRTNVVTDVTPTEISTRVNTAGQSNPGLIIFNRSWNMTQSGPWKYSPHDGSGIQTPLAVSKTWTFQSDEVNAANGNIWKRSGRSKVVGQETVTTQAGTFETFKIETSYSSRSVRDPTRKAEVTVQTWYAPAIDHWVKRTFVSRTDKHLMVNNTLELVEYGRKQ